MKTAIATAEEPEGRPTSFSMSRDSLRFAPAHISNVAASQAQAIFYESLNAVHPPSNHKVVAQVTVTVSYRFEPVT